MAGRHSILEPRGLMNTAAVRGFAIAGTAGVIAGAGLPTAVASESEKAEAKSDAVAATVVAIETEAAEETAPIVNIETISSGEWEIASVDFDVEEAVAEEAPVETEAEVAPAQAEPAAQQAPTQAAATTARQAAAPAETTTTRATQSTQAAAPAAQPAAPAPVASGSGSAVLNTALSYQGAPYRWGGTTPAGWDCIGFVRYVYAQHGVHIGGYTTSVLSAGRQVPYSQAQPGDILYWPGHVAIYAGNGQNMGAWNPSMGTKVGPNSYLGTPVVIRVFG